MIRIKEKAIGKKIVYEREIVNKKKKYTEIIDYRLATEKYKGKTFYVLYDMEQKSISPFFRFLNTEIEKQSENTREQAAYAIRLLYCYLALIKVDIYKLGNKDMKGLRSFLLGYSSENGPYSFDLKTLRKNASVDIYYSIYKSYLKYLKVDGIQLHALQNADINMFTVKNNRFTKIQKRAPRYISVSEYANIIKALREDNNVAGEIICRLMFEYGLRIGEVLGITSEDVKQSKERNKIVQYILLRNRASDNKKCQSAKRLMKVSDRSTYKSPNYQTEEYAYDKIYITESLYEILNDYIENVLVIARKKGKLACSLADKVDADNYYEFNHYIFLNERCSPLTAKSWNAYLKKIFVKLDIVLDSEKKYINLNHRFRHGFAMFQIQYRKIGIFELQKLMRHASVLSTQIYYRPTYEDEYELKTEFVKDLYDLVPGLKEIPVLYGEKSYFI